MSRSATRYELVRARRRLDRVESARELLSKRRQALVRELMRLARPAADARTRIGERAQRAYPRLLGALAARGGPGLETLGQPARELQVEVRVRSEWGVVAAEITDRPSVRRSVPARGVAPGSAGPTTVSTAEAFEELLDVLLEAASRESQMRRLARALARTTRLVNTLEQRVAPELEEGIRSMERVLDEREREEHTRLRHLLGRRGVRGGRPGGRPRTEDPPS